MNACIPTQIINDLDNIKTDKLPVVISIAGSSLQLDIEFFCVKKYAAPRSRS